MGRFNPLLDHLIIYNVSERSEEDIESTIGHELIHLQQYDWMFGQPDSDYYDLVDEITPFYRHFNSNWEHEEFQSDLIINIVNYTISQGENPTSIPEAFNPRDRQDEFRNSLVMYLIDDNLDLSRLINQQGNNGNEYQIFELIREEQNNIEEDLSELEQDLHRASAHHHGEIPDTIEAWPRIYDAWHTFGDGYETVIRASDLAAYDNPEQISYTIESYTNEIISRVEDGEDEDEVVSEILSNIQRSRLESEF